MVARIDKVFGLVVVNTVVQIEGIVATVVQIGPQVHGGPDDARQLDARTVGLEHPAFRAEGGDQQEECQKDAKAMSSHTFVSIVTVMVAW